MAPLKKTLLIALALVAATIFLRWPSFREMWSLDEANTCVFAQHILKGEVLYRDVTDTRTPLLVYLLAAENAVIGDWNLTGQHVVQAVIIGLTGLLLWGIGDRLGRGSLGAWTAAAFVIWQVGFLHPLDTYGISPEWYVIFFSALGFWYLATFPRAFSGWRAVAAGICFGLGYLAKQPGLLDFLTALVWVALVSFLTAKSWKQSFAALAGLVVGFAGTFGISVLYFAANHAWHDYAFYAWTYSSKFFLPEVSTADRLALLPLPLTMAWAHLPVLCVVTIAAFPLLFGGVAWSLRRRLAGQEIPLLILGWTASGLLGGALSGRLSGHYFIQMLPGISLATGWICDAVWQRSVRAQSRWMKFALIAVLLAPLGYSEWQVMQRRNSLDFLRDPARAVGELIRKNTRPEDRVFTWGFYPEINFWAQRLSASRFVFSNFLTGMIPWTNVAYDKDTAYAVVPGSWDQLWKDFERHPPAVIVDTATARSYTKYPLVRQEQLWAYIQKNYIEVETATTRRVGCRIYRRLEAPLPARPDVREDSSLGVQEMMLTGVHSGAIEATVPPGFTAAELVVNGKSTGSVTFSPESSHELAVKYVPAIHGKTFAVRVRAMKADGTQSIGPGIELSESQLTSAPCLVIGSTSFPAESIESLAGVISIPGLNAFLCHAPSRLVFHRPGTIRAISFRFGIADGAFAPGMATPTDGVEYQVDFQPDHGPSVRLFTHPLDPLHVGADRGPQSARVELPRDQSGRITISISPGPRSDPTSDWSYLSDLTADGPVLFLETGSTRVLPDNYETPYGFTPVVVDSQPFVHVHAPTSIDFPLRSDMHEIAGSFGMLDASWQNEKGHSPGLDFVAEQIAADGKVVEVWRQRLDPAAQPEDRGIHHFRFKLATPIAGHLRMKVVPAHPPDNSFGYAYWSNLVADPAP